MRFDDIYSFIKKDEELLKLYHNDGIFKKSIDYGDNEQWSNEKILLFALKNGYKAKSDILNAYVDYAKTDCRPIIINGQKYSIKDKGDIK